MTNRDSVGVAIASIPPRTELLYRAVGSVRSQTHPVDQVSIATDYTRLGAASTRQRALDGVTRDWVAFLDDDDWFYPHHVEKLVRFAHDTQADYVFSWFDVIGGSDPFPQHFGKKYDVTEPTHTTITVLVKTELARTVGFRDPSGGDGAGGSGEDWDFTLRCIDAGATIEHLPERTWAWEHHGRNTSGRSDRW